MSKAGTIDKTLFDVLPPVEGTPVIATNEQSTKNADYLGANWAAAVR
jgi:putative spermidine/putrescine transport system substrate-binding protein